MASWTGRLLGKYRVVDTLGRGGMAEVFKAFQANLDRYVALKIIHAHLVAEDASFIARFEAEAKAVASLRHPHIVQIHDFDADGDTPYMVMELIEGVTLKRHLEILNQNHAPLPIGETVRIVTEIGQALAYAHLRGMIHRDVKPANVMVDLGAHQPRMILTDFGLARLLNTSAQTATGSMVGTPAYMSPEQGMGRPADPRTDQYALGVMLFEMTTGRLPFEGDTPMATALKHITEPLPAPRALNALLPDALEQVMLTCLAKHPEDRFPNMETMLAALQEAVSGLLGQSLVAVVPADAPTQDGQATSPVRLTEPHRGEATDFLTSPGEARVSAVSSIDDVAPPPEPRLPPQLHGFVGRERELAHFQEQLAYSHLAVLTGMSGIGKTMLAAALAARQSDPVKVFWHTCHTGEGVDSLLWKLAGFLAWRRRPAVWQTLQTARLAGTTPPPVEILIDYVLQHLREGGFLLCLDDFHSFEDDPVAGLLGERLLAAAAAGEVAVILATQRLPAFLSLEAHPPLNGLVLADTVALLADRGQVLPPEVIQQLQARTGGNPQLVVLASATLRPGQNPARWLDRLAESESIERFLINEIDTGLTEAEREVMSAVAVLAGWPGTRAAIEAVLDGAPVRRTLNDLRGRHLLMMAETEAGKEYSQNGLVQTFYYEALSKRQRQLMHQRAAVFYTQEEPMPLRAARHWYGAGEAARAAQTILPYVRELLNAGEAQGVRALLEQLGESQVSAEQWTGLLLARGQVSDWLGDPERARQNYLLAYQRAATVSARAQACLGLGELLQTEAPTEAITWLRRGLAEITEHEPALRIRLGRILVHLGHWAEAEMELQAGLNRLPPGATRLRLSALGNLGNLAAGRGDVSQARAYSDQVVAGGRELKDWWLVAEALINLGIDLDASGQWAEAADQYRLALEYAEHMGSLNQTQRALLGLGNLGVKRGDHQAYGQLQRALDLARTHGWRSEQVYTAISLGGAYVHGPERNLLLAEALLAEAAQLAEQTETREPVPELLSWQAESHLAQGRPAAALQLAQQALALAEAAQAGSYSGIAWRVIGQAYWAQGAAAEAVDAWMRSAAVLASGDVYEAARTQWVWGSHTGDAVRQAAARTALMQLGVENW